MAILVKCPKCKCDIENDSYFCDQCGAELYICPQCKTFGKGKRCTSCGTELVRAKDFAGGAQPTPASQPVSQPTPQPTTQPTSQPATQPTTQATEVPQQASNAYSPSAEKTIRPGAPMDNAQPRPQPGHIVCYSPQHIRLGLASGVIIGRRGHYPSVFANFGDVSGNHARLDQIGAEWKITDLGSTNGTFLNGAQLQPNVAYNMNVGDKIRFSTLEFVVEV